MCKLKRANDKISIHNCRNEWYYMYVADLPAAAYYTIRLTNHCWSTLRIRNALTWTYACTATDFIAVDTFFVFIQFNCIVMKLITVLIVTATETVIISYINENLNNIFHFNAISLAKFIARRHMACMRLYDKHNNCCCK